jgi:diguanylate cyclase (GGDEF)-like protein
VIRANATPDRQEQSTTHYVAFSFQDNCLLPCWHQHNTIREAVASCIQSIDDIVKAFTDGRERPLTVEEQAILFKALLELLLEERELAHRDDITGALNRRALIEALTYESKRSRRFRRPLSIAYIDLDGFKKVNDLLRHSTGDKVLEVVARTMKRTLREMDSVSRLHGDEYALLLPETSYENAKVVVDKLRAALKSEMKANGWKITFSIGVVTFKTPPRTPEYMIDQADKVMLSVKKTGKNRVSYLVLDGDDLGFSTREVEL